MDFQTSTKPSGNNGGGAKNPKSTNRNGKQNGGRWCEYHQNATQSSQDCCNTQVLSSLASILKGTSDSTLNGIECGIAVIPGLRIQSRIQRNLFKPVS